MLRALTGKADCMPEQVDSGSREIEMLRRSKKCWSRNEESLRWAS